MKLRCRFHWHDWESWQWIPTAQVTSSITQFSAAQGSACRSCGMQRLRFLTPGDPYVLVGRFETHGIELLLDAVALWRDESGGNNADVRLREAIAAYEKALGRSLVVPRKDSNGRSKG